MAKAASHAVRVNLPFDVLKDMVSQLGEAELDELRQCIEQAGRKGRRRKFAKLRAKFGEEMAHLIDWDAYDYADREGNETISLEEVRQILAKIPDSMAALVIAEREERV